MGEKKIIRRRRNIEISAAIVLILIASWSVLLYYTTPQKIIEIIGVTNGYILVGLGGFLGGTSLFFPFPNYLLVFTLGAAQLNPFIIAIIATLGSMLGESTSYLAGHVGHDLLSKKWGRRSREWNERLIRTKPWKVEILLILIGMVPLPNDIILVPLGIMRYPFWKTIIPLGVGNLLFNIAIALIGYFGIGLF